MLKAGHNPAFNLLPFVSRLCNMQISMCLLCPLPTGSPMTPASWGVRRISFGYFCVVQASALSRRTSSCHWLNPRRIRRVSSPLHPTLYTSPPAAGLALGVFAEYPRLYTLHTLMAVLLLRIPAQDSPPPLHSTPYAPSWLSYSAGSPITLPPSVLLLRIPAQDSPRLYTLHPTLPPSSLPPCSLPQIGIVVYCVVFFLFLLRYVLLSLVFLSPRRVVLPVVVFLWRRLRNRLLRVCSSGSVGYRVWGIRLVAVQ